MPCLYSAVAKELKELTMNLKKSWILADTYMTFTNLRLFALPEGTELYRGKCSSVVGSHAHGGSLIFIMEVHISLAVRPDKFWLIAAWENGLGVTASHNVAGVLMTFYINNNLHGSLPMWQCHHFTVRKYLFLFWRQFQNFDCALGMNVWVHIFTAMESAPTPTACHAASANL